MWERGALAWCDGWEEGNHSHAYSPVCPYAKSEPHEAVLLILFGSRFVDSANLGLLHRTQHLCWYRRDDFPDRRLGEYLRRLRAMDRVAILSFFHKPTVCLGVTSLAVSIYGCDDGTSGPTRCALIDAALGDRYGTHRASRTSPVATRSAHSALEVGSKPA